MRKTRRHDLVLFGATGFVGRQAVAYLARHAGGLRWALAGRSAARLEEVRGQHEAGIIVADAEDAAALLALAEQARVVVSTAGPFALYGSKLVAACVQARTHYADITGETPWVHGLIARHHAQAAQDGTRIVPCCGFDSVPSDLGTWLLVQALQAEHGDRCVDVKAAFRLRGGLNGGTLASLFNVLDAGQRSAFEDPFLLNPPGSAPADRQRHADPVLPHNDPDFEAWVGPFFMGPVNTRVVRRSAALLGYASGFHYQEYLRFGSGAVAAGLAAAASAAALAGSGLLSFGPARRLAERLAPAPGEGPSVQRMDAGSFRCDLVATGERGSVLRGCIADRGDPGNRATTKFICEAGMLLASGQAGGANGGAKGGAGSGVKGGVLTPAAALGAAYAQRLRAAGMRVEPLHG